MSMYIVDCRYPVTTTPAGQPDFTVQVEAADPQHAIQVAQKIDAGDEFVAVGACETLALVNMLRSHVRILAEFGLEMARKSREARTDVAEFEALVSANGIAMPDGDEDDQEDEEDHQGRLSRAMAMDAKHGGEHPDYPEYMWRDDDTTRLDYWDWVAERLAAVDEDVGDDEDPWHGEYISDLRKREAKLAFEHYDFTAYGGVEDLVGWFGIGDEERALVSLGGYVKPEHVFVVEFAEDEEARIVHVGVEPFEKTPWRHIHHHDGAIIKYNRQTS